MFTLQPIADDAAWEKLQDELEGAPGRRSFSLTATLSYVRDRLHASHVIREDWYIDRDYRSAVSCFHSKQFARTHDLCTRYHFFNSPGEVNFDPVTPEVPGTYLGYVICRPVPESRHARTVLRVGNDVIAQGSFPCVGTFRPHLHQVTAPVDGVAFSKQDAAVMSCAETAIWTAARIMSKLHDHPLVLPHQISSLTSVGFAKTGRVLPSSGLYFDQMSHALSTLGFGPLYYDQHAYNSTWDPIRLSVPYLASGIPIVLGVPGHAITACGLLAKSKRDSVPKGRLQSTQEWADGIFVHDDGLGPYRLMPTSQLGHTVLASQGLADLLVPAAAPTGWVTADDVQTVLVPLLERIYLSAEQAEVAARAYLTPNGHGFKIIRDLLASLGTAGFGRAKEFLDLVEHGGLVYSLRCRRSVDVRRDLARADVPTVLRQALAAMPLPRYVWDIEVTSHDAFIGPRDERRLHAELIIDSTAHPHAGSLSVLFAHFPGVVLSAPRVVHGDTSIGADVTGSDHTMWRPDIPLWTDCD